MNSTTIEALCAKLAITSEEGRGLPEPSDHPRRYSLLPNWLAIDNECTQTAVLPWLTHPLLHPRTAGLAALGAAHEQ